jgi:signal transduction histidine kinase/ligand-binding sensor domain-containing protein/AraC-like DNA-binding protein
MVLLTASDNPNTHSLTTRDGLAGSTVNSWVQDDEGYIWLGTNAGLSRFDGYSMVNFYTLGQQGERQIDSNIGDLTLDRPHHLLWIRTATFHLACYDLSRRQFVSWAKDTRMAFSPWRNRLTTAGTWLNNDEQGLAFVGLKDGEAKHALFNVANHQLPSNAVTTLYEAPDGSVWVGTKQGIVVIDKQMKCTTIDRHTHIVQCKVHGNEVLMLTSDNKVLTFDAPSRRLLRRMAIPLALGSVEKVLCNFVWKGQWMIVTPHETLSYDLKTHRVQKPADCQVPAGQYSNGDAGYHYVSNKQGLFCIFTPQGKVIRLKLDIDRSVIKNNRSIHARMDRHHLLYITTYGSGLYTYDLKTGHLSHYSAADPFTHLPSDYLLWVQRDHSGGIWMGSESVGVTCITEQGSLNNEYVYPTAPMRLDVGNYVRSLCPLPNGVVKVGTRDNHLYEYNPKTGTMTSTGVLKAAAYISFIDSKGNLWTGTRGDGLYFNDEHYTMKGPRKVPVNDFYDIVEDSKGRIWLASWDGGLLMTKPQAGRPLTFQTFLIEANNANAHRVHDLELDTKGQLWIATNNGVYRLDTRKAVTQHSFMRVNPTNEAFPYDEVICLYVRGDALWVGTSSHGLIEVTDIDGRTISRRYSKDNGLSSNCVRSMVEDRDGNLWVGTDAGLTLLSLKGDKVINLRPYQLGPTIQGNVFAENCATRLDDGRLLFGTTHGLLALTVGDKAESKGSPRRPQITNLLVNGISAYSSESQDMELLTKLRDGGRIKLPYKQNSLVIEFSDFNYTNTSISNYQYRMDGVDDSWQPLTNQNSANYSNLPPGNYRFHVRAQAESGLWSPETTLRIRISQPWYNSWWAWCLYLIIIGIVASYILRNMRERARLHQQMEIDKQVTEFRLNFFTQIAHEFRTPLAIIKSAVDRIVNPETHQVSNAALQTAQHSTQRLSRLIDQLMEFRKIQTGNLKLNVESGDLVATVRDIFQDFWNMAQRKEQTLNYTPFAKKYTMLYDRQKVEMMVYNLLSNAIKYTPKHGEVTVTIKQDKTAKQVAIEVIDNGKGIDEQQRQRLFKPFMHGYASQGGMGIGLYSTAQMAAIHKGRLTYAPREGVQGSVFTLVLPDDEEVYGADDYKAAVEAVSDGETKEQLQQLVRELQPKALNSQLVAIVEDDPDMMQQLREAIGEYFQVDSYMDCASAIKGITETVPHLVLCDVMLPDGNGYQIVKAIRKEAATRDIPVVMLTAIDDEEHQIEGYKAGADDYFVKPCNFKLLLVRIMQLIKWNLQHRQQAEAKADEGTDHAEAPEGGNDKADAAVIIKTKADKMFVERMDFFIDKHLDDPTFNIDALATLMNMGRTKFYGKTKELTGLSPNAYIMNKRLTRAADLLAEGELTVSEVSYKAGFNTPQYFSKCFREKYGVSPREYNRQ